MEKLERLGIDLAVAHRAEIQKVVPAAANGVDEPVDDFLKRVVAHRTVGFVAIRGAHAVGRFGGEGEFMGRHLFVFERNIVEGFELLRLPFLLWPIKEA